MQNTSCHFPVLKCFRVFMLFKVLKGPIQTGLHINYLVSFLFCLFMICKPHSLTPNPTKPGYIPHYLRILLPASCYIITFLLFDLDAIFWSLLSLGNLPWVHGGYQTRFHIYHSLQLFILFSFVFLARRQALWGEKTSILFTMRS